MASYTPLNDSTSVFMSIENGDGTAFNQILVEPLNRLQKEIISNFLKAPYEVDKTALERVERMLTQVFRDICVTYPHSAKDVDDYVALHFPSSFCDNMLERARQAVENGKKKSGLILPVEKIHTILSKVLNYKIDNNLALFLTAILEEVARLIFRLAAMYERACPKPLAITDTFINIALKADKDLESLFVSDYENDLQYFPENGIDIFFTADKSYDSIRECFLTEERAYMEHLRILVKVFREPFAEAFPGSKDLDVIFSNIVDVCSTTFNLLTSIEDRIETTNEDETPLVGTFFADFAYAQELDIYCKYATDITKPNCVHRLHILLQNDALRTKIAPGGNNLRLAFKYLLPKLLLGPIYHCLTYSDVIKALLDQTTDDDDEESLEEALSSLFQQQVAIEGIFSQFPEILPKRRPRETMLHISSKYLLSDKQRIQEISKTVDGLEPVPFSSSQCLLMEGSLQKLVGKKERPMRTIFLTDLFLLSCKPIVRRTPAAIHAPALDPPLTLRLKEKIDIKKLVLKDCEDPDDPLHTFTLVNGDRDPSPITFCAKNRDEKNSWMAALSLLLCKDLLRHRLESKLLDERRHKLRHPSPERYKFAEADSSENILVDESDNSRDLDVVKGGTLYKLVERLTYHLYIDANFIRSFLTTFRCFCSPRHLLELLIERFDIPDPIIDDQESLELEENGVHPDVIRFRQEYIKPVQLRVLTVIRSWIKAHFSDFRSDPLLEKELRTFLQKDRRDRHLKRVIDEIIRYLDRSNVPEDKQSPVDGAPTQLPPDIEWHLTQKRSEFSLITLHPREFARQVTLLDHDLYRLIASRELVGTMWTRKDKDRVAPHVINCIHHTNKFTYWLVKCVVETENFDERVAVVIRLLEILQVFLELNNFNGVMVIHSVLGFSSVYRLDFTLSEVKGSSGRLWKVYEDVKRMNENHQKGLYDKLKQAQPPCIPFIGNYLTTILKSEEGNKTFLTAESDPYRQMINFTKWRRISEITNEIERFQDHRYVLEVQPEIRAFLEDIDPYEDTGAKNDDDLNQYFYKKSLEIEPRDVKTPPSFPRRHSYPLKSPGTRPTRGASRVPPVQLPNSRSHSTYSRLCEEESDSNPATPSTPLTPPPPYEAASPSTHHHSATTTNSSNRYGAIGTVSAGGQHHTTILCNGPSTRTRLSSSDVNEQNRQNESKETSLISRLEEAENFNNNIQSFDSWNDCFLPTGVRSDSHRDAPPPPIPRRDSLPPPVPDRSSRRHTTTFVGAVELVASYNAAASLPQAEQSAPPVPDRRTRPPSRTHSITSSDLQISHEHTSSLPDAMPRRPSAIKPPGRDSIGAMPPPLPPKTYRPTAQRGRSATPQLPPREHISATLPSIAHSRQQSS